MLVQAGDLDTLYVKIVDFAVELPDVGCASLHVRTAGPSQWRLVGARGLPAAAAAFWERADSRSSITIPDVEIDERLAGTEELRQMRLCGIRALHSTPLQSGSGELLGLLSLYWRREYRPSGDLLHFLGALGRLSARLIERTSLEEARRASESSLRVKVAAVERIDREKNSFLAMLAHELRSPLAPIRSANEVLANMLRGQPAGLRPLAVLARQTEQLARLVDDLLDISRIEQGLLTLQERPVEVGEILEQALETVQPLVRQKNHELTVARLPAPAFVLGDRGRLVQCLANLLQNATKYTQPGGRIRVSVVESGSKLSITVRDNGAGIAPAILPRVFEPFVQGQRTLEHALGGLGIGLAIVRRLIELHGGSVEATSPGEGRGSSFTIHLWRLESPRSPEAPPRSVLVVDADANAADALAAMLSAKGYRVEAAYSALSALAAAEQLRPDAILIEIDLPKMSGYELSRRLRAQPALGATLLIAVSGRAEDPVAVRAAGFDEQLAKPVANASLEQLLSRVPVG